MEEGSWLAAPLKKLRVTKITEVASVNDEEKDHLCGYLQKKKAAHGEQRNRKPA